MLRIITSITHFRAIRDRSITIMNTSNKLAIRQKEVKANKLSKNNGCY